MYTLPYTWSESHKVHVRVNDCASEQCVCVCVYFALGDDHCTLAYLSEVIEVAYPLGRGVVVTIADRDQRQKVLHIVHQSFVEEKSKRIYHYRPSSIPSL